MIGHHACDLVPAYANAGIKILPLHSAPGGHCTCGNPACGSAAKHPRLKHGVHEATTDLGVIAEWLARWPDGNWGGCPPEGVIVLDIDPRNGGHDTLAALEAKHNPLPSTLTARTGSGGRHHWFTYRGPTRGKLADGIDVKKAGGYVVLPPSRHACGGTYAWIRQSPAVPAPWWLRRLLDPPRPTFAQPVGPSGGIDRLAGFLAGAQEGERNASLFWASCRAFEGGLDPAPLVDVALSIGLTMPEITATIRSAERAPARSGR